MQTVHVDFYIHKGQRNFQGSCNFFLFVCLFVTWSERAECELYLCGVLCSPSKNKRNMTHLPNRWAARQKKTFKWTEKRCLVTHLCASPVFAVFYCLYSKLRNFSRIIIWPQPDFSFHLLFGGPPVFMKVVVARFAGMTHSCRVSKNFWPRDTQTFCCIRVKSPHVRQSRRSTLWKHPHMRCTYTSRLKHWNKSRNTHRPATDALSDCVVQRPRADVHILTSSLTLQSTNWQPADSLCSLMVLKGSFRACKRFSLSLLKSQFQHFKNLHMDDCLMFTSLSRSAACDISLCHMICSGSPLRTTSDSDSIDAVRTGMRSSLIAQANELDSL